MPSNYAHYRFAQSVVDQLESQIWDQTAMYYAGCHGADPMFYYDPFHKNPVRAIGDDYHRITGRELFTMECDRLRKGCSDAELAFLFGFLTHYCLDSSCHPFVNGLVRQKVCGHAALETEFDRFLMARDGIHNPHLMDLSEHVSLTNEQCALAATFFPPLKPEEYVTSLKKMHKANRLLTGGGPLPRWALERILEKGGGNVRDQMMRTGPDPRTAHLDKELLEYYRKAEQRFPELLRQLTACLEQGTPLGAEFDANFE